MRNGTILRVGRITIMMVKSKTMIVLVRDAPTASQELDLSPGKILNNRTILEVAKLTCPIRTASVKRVRLKRKSNLARVRVTKPTQTRLPTTQTKMTDMVKQQTIISIQVK